MKPTDRNIKYLIHQSNLIEGYDNPEHDKESWVAWQKLAQIGFDALEESDICNVQKIIVTPQTDLHFTWRGRYRKIRVSIGGRICPDPVLVQGMMNNWLLDYKTLDPVIAHVWFEQIHPFVDGNGRTGRMLLWWSQMKQGKPLTKITYANRQNYYGWFA